MELQETVDGCNKNDIIIVMGDLNAKVGKENTGYERTIDVNDLGNMNISGERLLEILQTEWISHHRNTLPHKDIHKATWDSPDGKLRNQIDHLMISTS